jgi:hypothetical protein
MIELQKPTLNLFQGDDMTAVRKTNSPNSQDRKNGSSILTTVNSYDILTNEDVSHPKKKKKKKHSSGNKEGDEKTEISNPKKLRKSDSKNKETSPEGKKNQGKSTPHRSLNIGTSPTRGAANLTKAQTLQSSNSAQTK